VKNTYNKYLYSMAYYKTFTDFEGGGKKGRKEEKGGGILLKTLLFGAWE